MHYTVLTMLRPRLGYCFSNNKSVIIHHKGYLYIPDEYYVLWDRAAVVQLLI